jgi:hypothetical protein
VKGKRREDFLELARRSSEPNWLQSLAGMTQELKSLVQQESDAKTIRNYESLLVPGLLQTPDYARAYMSESEVMPADHIEQRLEARKLRQRLLNGDHRPVLYVIIEESVLLRPLGGPQVMAGQLRWLLHLGRRPEIRIHILPRSVGAHPGLAGPFVIMDYADGTPIVYLENAVYSHSVDEAKLVAAYVRMFNRLAESALDEGKSADLVAELAAKYAERSE